MAIDKKIGFERLDRGEILICEMEMSCNKKENSNYYFQMKIIRGKKTVKWTKRREGKNM